MTSSRYDLLPPNATQLERDISRATSSLERVGEPVGIIRTAKRVDIPDSVVPWLIYEYGLGEILPYLGNNQRRALAEGLLWQRIRGTKEALRIALGWIEIEGLIEESEAGTDRWAEFQLGLDERTTGEASIDAIVGVARLSAPARSRLQRIYAVHDWRRAVYDECSWDDGSIYDDHSGVRPRADWPQISYGQVIGTLVQGGGTIGGSVSVSATTIEGAIVFKDDIFRWDENNWDDGWHAPNPHSLLTNLEGNSAATVNCRSWATAGYWGNRTWANGLSYAIGNGDAPPPPPPPPPDTTPPTISISSSDNSLSTGETATITFTLSEASANFTASDVSVSGGSLSTLTYVNATTYTATFTPFANSTANGVISVATGAFSDAAGNTNTTGATLVLTVNTNPPGQGYPFSTIFDVFTPASVVVGDLTLSQFLDWTEPSMIDTLGTLTVSHTGNTYTLEWYMQFPVYGQIPNHNFDYLVTIASGKQLQSFSMTHVITGGTVTANSFTNAGSSAEPYLETVFTVSDGAATKLVHTLQLAPI
jgi:P2-related tail formation protein